MRMRVKLLSETEGDDKADEPTSIQTCRNTKPACDLSVQIEWCNGVSTKTMRGGQVECCTRRLDHVDVGH